MTELPRNLQYLAGENGTRIMNKFDDIINSFNPPEPLYVIKLALSEDRDLILVYEDEECEIYMEK